MKFIRYIPLLLLAANYSFGMDRNPNEDNNQANPLVKKRKRITTKEFTKKLKVDPAQLASEVVSITPELIATLKQQTFSYKCHISNCSEIIHAKSLNQIRPTLEVHLRNKHSKPAENLTINNIELIKGNTEDQKNSTFVLFAQCLEKGCGFVSPNHVYTLDDAYQSLRCHNRTKHQNTCLYRITKERFVQNIEDDILNDDDKYIMVVKVMANKMSIDFMLNESES